MKQLKFFVDMNREEAYLNRMAENGWLFEKRTMPGIYYFKKGTPKQAAYKLDYRNFKEKEDFESYVALFEDAGYKHIWGTIRSGHQYFLPESKEAPREIFSDRESSAQRYIRLQKNFMIWLAMMLVYILVDLISVDFVLSELFFLTPGLWEMQGARFWKAFWFEFPFMLMRILPVAFFAIVALLNLFWAIKARRLYKSYS